MKIAAPFSSATFLAAIVLATACTPDFQVEETTIAEIHAAMEAARPSAE